MKSSKLIFWLLAALGLGVFLFTRFYHILSLPIFTDEAIYVRWAQIARFDAFWRFISLTDGKQPMFVWFAMIFIHLIHDPLFASRSVSVLAGFGTMIGLYFLGTEIFKNKWVGLTCALFYVIYPFGLVYDRMALYDSMVGAFTVWVIYLEIVLVRRLRTDTAFLLGLVSGGSVLTKTSGFFGIYLLPLSLLLFNPKTKNKRKEFIKWCGLAILVTGLTYLYYSVLRLSPFYSMINTKNATFVYPLHEWLSHPFRFFYGNLVIGEWNWLYTYMTMPILLLIAAAFFIKGFFREKLFLFAWFLLPFVALALFGKVLYPRFILFMTLPLIPLISYSLVYFYGKFKNKYAFGIVCLLLFFFALRSDFLIITDFAHSPIPDSDVNQYGVDWPSGGGVKEAIQFFQKQSETQKIYVATEGTFGLLPAAFEMYLENNPNIQIQGYWPMSEDVRQELYKKSHTETVYFVFYQPCQDCTYPGLAPSTWHFKQVYQYKKAQENRYFTIYQVIQ